MPHEDVASNRSALKDFLASIATISGDLSNITAPPFVLLENSTVELPQYWADHPHLFVAPAAERDPAKRALCVLKWFLGSLRNQQYAGRQEDEGVKKPVNAFLGELFLGSWKDEELGETCLVSEQVSHHPPITACYLWNGQHGISAEGFTQQEITFSGNVHIRQKGFAVLHIDAYEEDYLIPVPNVKVKGILTGPYPELHGEYSLISSSGFVSQVKFQGKSLFGSGRKNGFEARMFHVDRPEEDVFTVEGVWNGESTIVDMRSGQVVETFDVGALQQRKLEVRDLDEQDPWESRRAWSEVIAALKRGDMKGTTEAKAVIEEGQRQMRKEEEARGEQWKPLFYQRVSQDPVFDKLSVHDNGSFTVDAEGGIWKVNREAVKSVKKPYHGDLVPSNKRVGDKPPQESRRTRGTSSVSSRSREKVASPAAVGSTLNGHAESNGQLSEHVNGISGKRSIDTPVEEMRAMGVAEGTPDHTQPNGSIRSKRPSTQVDTSREPTDAEVEAFLRAKHSNLH